MKLGNIAALGIAGLGALYLLPKLGGAVNQVLPDYRGDMPPLTNNPVSPVPSGAVLVTTMAAWSQGFTVTSTSQPILDYSIPSPYIVGTKTVMNIPDNTIRLLLVRQDTKELLKDYDASPGVTIGGYNSEFANLGTNLEVWAVV